MRHLLKRLSYRAIDRGYRLPRMKDLDNFVQVSRTIDLIRNQRVTLLLDVGANKGWYAYHLRRSGYRSRLISFEPIPGEAEHIRALAKDDPLWTVECMALGEENGTKSFNRISVGEERDETLFSSFLDPIQPIGNRTARVDVEIRRLEDVLRQIVPDLAEQRIFLKMDTQGFDLSVLAGAQGILDRVVLLQSEISVEPLYVGMPPYTQSLDQYRMAGFRLCDLFVVNRTKDGTILEYDCLMQRDIA